MSTPLVSTRTPAAKDFKSSSLEGCCRSFFSKPANLNQVITLSRQRAHRLKPEALNLTLTEENLPFQGVFFILFLCVSFKSLVFGGYR